MTKKLKEKGEHNSNRPHLSRPYSGHDGMQGEGRMDKTPLILSLDAT